MKIAPVHDHVTEPGLQNFKPDEEMDAALNVSAQYVILGRLEPGEGPHEEIDIALLAEEASPAAGHYLLLRTPTGLFRLNIANLPTGGGGGSSDSLGTGFTAGGGTGSIPANTIANMAGIFRMIAPDGVEIGRLPLAALLGADLTGISYYSAGVRFTAFGVVANAGLTFYDADVATGQVSRANVTISRVTFESGGDVRISSALTDIRLTAATDIDLRTGGAPAYKLKMPNRFGMTNMTTTTRGTLTSLVAGDTIYCSNAIATDGSTGVMQTWNGSAWKNHW